MLCHCSPALTDDSPCETFILIKRHDYSFVCMIYNFIRVLLINRNANKRSNHNMIMQEIANNDLKHDNIAHKV
jgi:hypothetical protein